MTFDQFWHGSLRRPYHLYTTDSGGDGPVIVLLHGIAASSDRLIELTSLLTPDFRCITIDLLGFGKSPKPQWHNYHLEDHVASVRHSLQRMGIYGSFTFVGHSMGALIATRYASRYQRAIKRLVLLSPPVYAPLETITSPAAKRRTALYFRLYKFFRLHPRITPENFERLKRILPLPRSVIRNRATWIPFERSLEHCIEQQTILQDIDSVRCPVSIYYGNLDTVIVPYNIRALLTKHNLQVYQLNGVNHEIGKRYARAVAINLVSQQDIS